MKLHVTNEAADWYVHELELAVPNQIRLFPRYGGVGGVIPGFSIGINHDDPKAVYASTKAGDIHFFIEENDAWYFENYHLTIELNKDLNEPEFIYETKGAS